MEARAVLRFKRISPRKARVVADLIRGKTVEEALSILALTPKKASPLLRKVILSATANIRHNVADGGEIDHDRLFVTDIRIDPGPTMKRIRPRARGRAGRIIKPFARLRIVGQEQAEAA